MNGHMKSTHEWTHERMDTWTHGRMNGHMNATALIPAFESPDQLLDPMQDPMEMHC